MAYSNNAALLLELSVSELAKLSGDPTGTIIDEDRVNYARDMGDAIINSYLYGRYDVPFEEPILPIIAKLSVDLTIVHLYEFVYRNSTIPSTVLWRKLSAYKMLKEIREGEISILFGAHGTTAPPPILSNKTESERLFTNELLEQFSGE